MLSSTASFAAETSGIDVPARFAVSGETLQFRHSAEGRFSVHAEPRWTPSEPQMDIRFRLHATSNDKAACSIGGPALFSDGFES